MACQSMTNLHIRWMIRRDMTEVLECERLSFDEPWSEEDFVRFLRQRNNIGMVVEHEEEVIGYMLYELYKTRLILVGLAVLPAYRRRGVGGEMVNMLKGKLSFQRKRRVDLFIVEDNLAGQQFFRAMGFRAMKTCPDHFDNGQAAYLMSYDIDPPGLPRNRMKEYFKSR